MKGYQGKHLVLSLTKGKIKERPLKLEEALDVAVQAS